jgi:mannose-6-phosphate isomerase
MDELSLPLTFTPSYQSVVWGGRRMEQWRKDLPSGPIGESWDLADHTRGMSVVAEGALKGATLRELTARFGKALVGGSWTGGEFPLMVKLIDANDRLSVQVHPDDDLARAFGVGSRGKTECWLLVADGGELYVGTRPGGSRASFEAALKSGSVAEQLNRFVVSDGDFFFLAARTVHALGRGCLLYEVQQTCDVTFRVDDWGRVGLDGKPRPLHIAESMATIDFAATSQGPVRSPTVAHPSGGSVRRLADCPYFSVEERRARHTSGGGNGACSIVVCLGGTGELATAAGSLPLTPMRSYLVPAAAGAWTATVTTVTGLRLLVAQPA